MELLELFSDFTLQIVALGSAILGFVSGALGTFAVLRKQSLLGDSISHAALPGIILAFMLTGSKAPIVLLVGAALAGWLGTYFILSIINNTRIDTDGAQGIVLSVFFGIGLLLLTFLQKRPVASQAGLDKFLFGQAAAILPSDVWAMSIFGGLALFLMIMFWKEFKLSTFDPTFGASMGFVRNRIDFLITGLIVLSIVIGLQTVGVILMSAMVVTPAAAARQWTDRLSRMVLLSGLFGALSGIVGSILSSAIPDLPTGPTIVICLTVIVVLSFLLAPGRGLAAKALRGYRNRHFFSLQSLLVDMHLLEKEHPEYGRFHEQVTISLMKKRPGNIRYSLQALEDQHMVENDGEGKWRLTEAGTQRAASLEEGRTDEV